MTDHIEPELCQCGCGRRTSIATRSRTRTGQIKGQPMRYICGHTWKNKKGKGTGPENANWKGGRVATDRGYIDRRLPSHHRAKTDGYVSEHIVLVEKTLGKPLPKGSVCHHVNGDLSDNRNSNLVICQDQTYHLFLHQRQRALRACGHADWLKCVVCKRYDLPENLYIDGSHRWHRQCINRYHKELRANAKSH